MLLPSLFIFFISLLYFLLFQFFPSLLFVLLCRRFHFFGVFIFSFLFSLYPLSYLQFVSGFSNILFFLFSLHPFIKKCPLSIFFLFVTSLLFHFHSFFFNLSFLIIIFFFPQTYVAGAIFNIIMLFFRGLISRQEILEPRAGNMLEIEEIANLEQEICVLNEKKMFERWFQSATVTRGVLMMNSVCKFCCGGKFNK